MGQALYRKYRSKSLEEIIGQKHITDTLRRAIASKKVSHAYLFTGPRGVGKTSIARILAHELNEVPYTDERSHLDIIEIDAASNGGVEEIRDLRDKVHIAPSSGKYKIYIIDEVHMMTTSAFNALLKTLEEPPAHAIFILATTEAHKLPATIISRTQRFTFKPVPRNLIKKHLRYIADQEHINIDDSALELIAEHSEGSFRDSISMLDQAGSAGVRVELSDVEGMIGVPAASIADDIIRLLDDHDAPGVVNKLTQLRSDGYQASAITKLLSNKLRSLIVAVPNMSSKKQKLLLLRKFIDVPASNNPDQLLELVLLESLLDEESETKNVLSPISNNAAPQRTAYTAPPIVQPTIDHAKGTTLSIPKLIHTNIETETNQHDHGDTVTDAVIIVDSQWQLVLASLRKQYNTLYGIIRMAQPEFLPGRVKLTFGFAFHQKRANDVKNKQLLMAVLENVTGHRIAIECLFDRDVTPPAPIVSTSPTPVGPTASTTDPSLETISNIFGGGELLGS